MYIIFEGIDGVGKTTLLKSVSHALNREGIPNHIVKEPTSAFYEIQKMMYDEGRLNDDLLLHIIDRHYLYFNAVKPILEAEPNTIFLSDRSFISSIAYQDVDGWDYKTVFNLNLNFNLPFFLTPSLIVFFPVNYDDTLITKVNAAAKTHANRLSQKVARNTAYLREVADKYKKFIKLISSSYRELHDKTCPNILSLPHTDKLYTNVSKTIYAIKYGALNPLNIKDLLLHSDV